MSRWRSLLLGLIVIIGACSPTRGCVESSFTFAPDSELPVWFEVHGAARSTLVVTVDYWLGPLGGTGVFKMFDASGRELADVIAKRINSEPVTLGPLGRPSYEMFIADGKIEFIEHRQYGGPVHVSVNAEVRRALEELARGITTCESEEHKRWDYSVNRCVSS